MAREPQSELVFRDTVRAVFRHKWMGGLFFITAMTGAILWNVFCPNTYRSEGRLLVRLGRESVALDPTVTMGREPTINLPTSRESEINSIVEALRSRVLVEKVVDTFGPAVILDEEKESRTSGPASARLEPFMNRLDVLKRWIQSRVLASETMPRDRAIREVNESLAVVSMAKSNVIGVSYDSPNPQLSQDVLSKLIEDFQEQHSRLNRPSGAQEFFDQQAIRLRADLARVEDELRQLKQSKGLVSPSDRRKILEDRVGHLEDDLLRGRADVASAESVERHLAAQLDTLPTTELASQTAGFANEGTDQMRDRLYGLQLEMEEVRARYTDAHPKMQEIQDQVTAARQLLDKEERTRNQITTTPDKAYEQSKLSRVTNAATLASLRARTASLEADLAEARRQLDDFNDTELRITRLERERAIRETNYHKYSAALEESRIDKALEDQGLSNISIVQPATHDNRPYRPRRLVNLLIGLVGGVFGGLATTVLLEYLDRSFITASDIEKRLKIPTLAAIPRLPSQKLRLNGR
ncbi:MAG: hypothetical protein ABFD16_16725 [Thermoguttaceae bacterium]|jgi:uncharacterized protein involved in exopolysaccharide biosynthesis